MESYPKITVVTPSYNQAKFLETTIRSVLEQNYPNLEYIVQDGGSTDGSVEIIKKYADRLNYWESGPDGGQSAAINKGFSRASGDYLTWINSDDQLAPNALRSLAQGGWLRPNTLTVGKCRIVDEAGEFIRQQTTSVQDLKDLFRLREVWHSGGYIVQPETVFARSLFESVGGLRQENHYSMDYELWIKMLSSAGTLLHAPIEVGIFRSHAAQKVASKYAVFESLLETARCGLEECAVLSDNDRSLLLQDLTEHERERWLGKGRLAYLPVPRSWLMAFRKWYHLRG